MQTQKEPALKKRLLIQLPGQVALDVDLVLNSPFFELSKSYFDTVTEQFKRWKVSPDYVLGAKLYWSIYSIAKNVLSDAHLSVQSISIRSVFEQHESYLLELYQRADRCVTPKDVNFFNTFFVYLDAPVADLLRQRLMQLNEIEVTESNVDFPDIPISTTNSATDYQSLMGIKDIWNAHALINGNKGQNAHCVIVEYSFTYDRSSQSELATATTTLATATTTDDRMTNDQWQRVRKQSGTSTYGYESHSDSTLSVLKASHSYSPRTDTDYKGIVPQVNIDQLVSLRQLTSTHSTTPTFQPEIALLIGILSSQPNSGTILLIEFELTSNNQYRPVETDSALFWLVYIASKCFNITVIEPAGSSAINVDNLYTNEIIRSKDSGAILVGAARFQSKIFINQNNYSSRSERFVYAPVPVGVFPNKASYDKTSAASAIIAGIACLIQSIYKSFHGSYLTSSQLRELLCKPKLSASVSTPVRGSQSVIPNVKSILTALELWRSTSTS